MTSILTLLLSSAAVFALVSYLRLRVTSATEYASAAASFFRSAGDLAEAKDAPAEFYDMLECLNESIDDPRATWSVLSYLTDDKRWTKDRDADQRRRKILVEYLHARPDVEARYKELLVQWFVAVTALSPLVGRVARWAMTESTIEAAVRRKRRLRLADDRRSGPSSDKRVHA